MVDTKYITDDYKFRKINIGAVMKKTEILKFIPDHIKIKKMCKHEVKKLPFVTRYVSD